jgi:uncharacterized protein
VPTVSISRGGLAAAFFGLIVLLIVSCASYSTRIQEPRKHFDRGEYDVAIEELKKLTEKKDNDELLYWMDLGMVFHTAGRYPEAINAFSHADKLAEIKDYTSLTQEAASVMLSDQVKPYKGEDFEKIMVNMYLALDYTMLHKWEDALVECRRVNHKIDMMISQGGLPYEQNAFAKYLAASLFEAQNEINDAFVDYRNLLKWKSNLPYLAPPLLRIAADQHDYDELEEYQKRFPDVTNYKIGKNQGEIILLLEQGRAPVKVPSPAFRLLPTFRRQNYTSDYAWLRVGEGNRARTFSLYDVEATAIKELDHRTGLIIAKKVTGIVLKEVAAEIVAKETHSPIAGALTSILLHATDSADLRSWTTLPARLQLARLVVPAGRQDIDLDMVTNYGSVTRSVKRWTAIQVKPGEKVFLNYRFLN